MSRHPTSPSPSQKIRYANGPSRIAANKKRKMRKHLKLQPKDEQTRKALEKL